MNEHCYGMLNWNVKTIYGMRENVTTACLSVPNPNDNFASSEMWLRLPGNRWVEEGVAYGAPLGNFFYTYWADQNLNGYYETDQEAAVYNQTYDDQISVDSFSSGTWYIYRNGVNVGESRSNPGPVGTVQAGTETTSGAEIVRGSGDALQWEDTTSTWHSGWSSPGFAGVYASGVIPITDSSSNVEYSFGNCTFPDAAPSATTYSNSASDILARAKQLASANGDNNPADIEQTHTTGSQEAKLMPALQYDTASGTGSTVIVEMTGSFTGYAAKVPAGHSKPTGNTLIMTFDRTTGKLAQWSIQNSHVNLSALGSVTTIS